MSNRTPEQDSEMIALAQSSLYHWTQREDCQPRNLSIGMWQVSRVYAVLESATEALRYASACLKVSEENELDAFCLTYAHEAMARAYSVASDIAQTNHHLTLARDHAEQIDDAESTKMALADLETIQA